MEMDNNKYFCSCCGYTCSVEEKKPVDKNIDSSDSLDLLNKIEKEKTELIEKCALSVCKVYNQIGEAVATGTGWRGSDSFIITNAHVVEYFNNPSVASKGLIVCEYSNKLNLYSRQKQEMVIVFYDRVEDIAILKPRNGSIPNEVPVLSISSKITHQGDMVFTIGNPLHYKFTYTEGSVANPQYEAKGSGRKYPVLQTTLTLNCGNSGGPVFNTKGDVVGMTTFSELEEDNSDQIGKALFGEVGVRYKEIAGYGFCVTGEVINNALNNLEKVR